MIDQLCKLVETMAHNESGAFWLLLIVGTITSGAVTSLVLVAKIVRRR